MERLLNLCAAAMLLLDAPLLSEKLAEDPDAKKMLRRATILHNIALPNCKNIIFDSRLLRLPYPIAAIYASILRIALRGPRIAVVMAVVSSIETYT